MFKPTHLLYDLYGQDITPGLRSDHSVVKFSLKIKNTQQKGRGFFKFNASLLKDTKYVQEIKTIITDFKANNLQEKNFGLQWDTLKCLIRGHTIGYATAKKKKSKEFEQELKSRAEYLEICLNSTNYEEYNTIKKELEQINNEYSLGQQIRSKAKYIEESEQNSAFFSREETRNYNTRYIRSLYSKDDQPITDPKQMLAEEESFYKELETKPPKQEIDNSLFNTINTQKLNKEQVEICDAPITIEELGKSLKELPNKKSPGSDGLTSEFYNFFWPNIKEIVFNSLSHAFNNNTLSIEQKRGILTLIPKKGKDLRRLKHWRPLTLLNTDYKILTKLLAIRLQKVISSLISRDQSGYIKGRFIGENIRNIYDIIDFTALNNIEGMIVAIDFEKAFDSISWEFLFETLKCFNFGDNFIKWVKILYSSPECCVINNGYYSEFFQITRGIRQGCPISALLFILVVEIMAIHIRQNPNIHGIKYAQNEEIVISQLADDTTLFLVTLYHLNMHWIL